MCCLRSLLLVHQHHLPQLGCPRQLNCPRLSSAPSFSSFEARIAVLQVRHNRAGDLELARADAEVRLWGARQRDCTPTPILSAGAKKIVRILRDLEAVEAFRNDFTVSPWSWGREGVRSRSPRHLGDLLCAAQWSPSFRIRRSEDISSVGVAEPDTADAVPAPYAAGAVAAAICTRV